MPVGKEPEDRDPLSPPAIDIFFDEEHIARESAIGRMLHQDHTTILASVKVIEDLLFADEMVQTDVKAIKELIAQTKSEVSPYCIPGIHLVKKYA